MSKNLILSTIFPVVPLFLGEFEKKDPAKSKRTEAIVQYKYALFYRQAKDHVFLLNSENDSDPMIPALKDANKDLTVLDLNNLKEWTKALNQSMIKVLSEFLSDPMGLIDGVSPYMLYCEGFLSEAFFKSLVVKYLGLATIGRNVTINDIDLSMVLPLMAKHTVNKTPFGNSDQTFDQMLLSQIVALENKAKALAQSEKKDNSKTVDTTAKTVSKPKKIKETKDPDQSMSRNDKPEADQTIPQGISAKQFYSGIDWSKQNKTAMLTACKDLGLSNYSKLTTKQLRDLIEDHVTQPDQVPATV